MMACNRRAFVLASAGAALAVNAGRVTHGAAQDAPVNLVVYADTVQGGKNISEEDAPMRSCVLTSRFPRNSEVVWRSRVIDPKTGLPMDDTTLEKLEVKLSDGQVFPMSYGGHPPRTPKEFYWTAAWTIPKDYTTGTFGYSIDAVALDGRTGQFKPFEIASSLPSVTDEVLADAEE